MCINFRLAIEEDCDLLFEWVNDSKVRENAFRSDIIYYKEHKEWFQKKIKSDTTKIFIADKAGQPIGQIRIDIDNDVGIIDYSVAPIWRGKGYGSKLLIEIVPVIQQYKLSITKLIGRVKCMNVPSQKVFDKAGYTKKYKEEYIEYTKELV